MVVAVVVLVVVQQSGCQGLWHKNTYTVSCKLSLSQPDGERQRYWTSAGWIREREEKDEKMLQGSLLRLCRARRGPQLSVMLGRPGGAPPSHAPEQPDGRQSRSLAD